MRVLIEQTRKSGAVHLPAGILLEIVIGGEGLLTDGKVPEHGGHSTCGASFTEVPLESLTVFPVSKLFANAVINGLFPERLNVQLALGAALLHQLNGLWPGNILAQAMATEDHQGDSSQGLLSHSDHPGSPILIFDDSHSTLCPGDW